MRLPCNLSSPGGMHQCDSVDGLLICLRLCSRTHHLLVSLHYVCTLCMQFSATETSFQTPPARQRGEACDLVSARHRRHSLKVIASCHPRYPQGLLEICIAVAGLFDYFGPSLMNKPVSRMMPSCFPEYNAGSKVQSISASSWQSSRKGPCAFLRPGISSAASCRMKTQRSAVTPACDGQSRTPPHLPD